MALKARLNLKTLSCVLHPRTTAIINTGESAHVSWAAHRLCGRQKSSYIHHVGGSPLQYITMGQVLQRAADSWPDRPALISRHQGITILYSELLTQADQLAASFLEIGLQPGDRLGIWSPNSYEWVLSMLASARAGLISVAINPSYQKTEITYCLKKVGVKALVVPEKHGNVNYYQMLSDIFPELQRSRPGQLNSSSLPELKSIVMISENNDMKGVYSLEKLKRSASSAAADEIARRQHLVKPDAGCNVQFTSGTTGHPKAPLLTHTGIVNNGYVVGLRNELNIGLNKICVQVPLFHVFGAVASLSAGLQHGATLVLPSGTYSAAANLEALLAEKCTVVHGTPTMFMDLVSAVQESGASLSVRVACTGGAPVSPKLIKDIARVLRVSAVKSIYGMTECTGISFQSLPGDAPDVCTYSVGQVHDHLEVKAVDTAGQLVPFGEPGELHVRGYSTMIGYWDEEEKTREIIGPDRWVATGDLVVLQEDGYCVVVGRLKDIIIRGGENISPKEIEDIISSHPNVLECHVLGVPDERLGEEVCAAVRMREGTSLSQEDLKRHCAGRLARYKHPRLIKQLESFPKTTSGKVQKFKIREMIEKGEI